MARGNTIRVLRTTRAALTAQAAASGLIAGEPYLITDEDRFAIAASAGGYRVVANQFDLAPNFATATDGDTTPSVAGLGGRDGILYIPASTSYTITNFDDGISGQQIVVFNSGSSSFTLDRSNAHLSGSSNQTVSPLGSLRLVRFGSTWKQISPTMTIG